MTNAPEVVIAECRHNIYPHIDDFVDGMLGEIDHAIDKYPFDNVSLLEFNRSVEVLKREVAEVIAEVSPSDGTIVDKDNFLTELKQVAGVCMMMYTKFKGMEFEDASTTEG